MIFTAFINGFFRFKRKGWYWDYIIPKRRQYISDIYCQLGDYILPTTLYRNLKNPLKDRCCFTKDFQLKNPVWTVVFTVGWTCRAFFKHSQKKSPRKFFHFEPENGALVQMMFLFQGCTWRIIPVDVSG